MGLFSNNDFFSSSVHLIKFWYNHKTYSWSNFKWKRRKDLGGQFFCFRCFRRFLHPREPGEFWIYRIICYFDWRFFWAISIVYATCNSHVSKEIVGTLKMAKICPRFPCCSMLSSSSSFSTTGLNYYLQSNMKLAQLWLPPLTEPFTFGWIMTNSSSLFSLHLITLHIETWGKWWMLIAHSSEAPVDCS